MLNDSQLRAVIHNKGPAMVIAGPGSGKTYTIIQRILYLIQKIKVLPSNILVLTFSKNAANEMKSRYYNETMDINVHFATFHSLAYYILREYFNLNKLSIVNENQKFNILKNIISNRNISLDSDYIYCILSQISKSKNSIYFNNPAPVSNSETISLEQLNEIVEEYNEFLIESNLVDFDDLVILCINKLKHNENILEQIHHKFKYILIDEFQDINYPQYILVNLLKGSENNLFIVGDDDQSIYGFRGSCPSIMQQFQKDNLDVNVIFMSDNYRCKSNIVNFSSSIISDNVDRFKKNLKAVNNGGNLIFKLFETREDEEEYVKKHILTNLNSDYSNTAVIVRTNIEVNLWEKFFTKNHIPVSSIALGDKNIKESFILNDIRSFISYIYNGNHREDFIIFMNKPVRFIQRRAIVNDQNVEKDLTNYYKNNSKMNNDINNLFNKIHLAEKSNPYLAIQIFRKTLKYESYLKEISKNSDIFENNIKTLDTIHNMFKKYKPGDNIDNFISSALYGNTINTAETKTENKGIHIITMHTSKGLEFDNVILPDVNEGIIPSKRTYESGIEEERRLLYVAITRAKNNLLITATKERNRDISRFIKNKVNRQD